MKKSIVGAALGAVLIAVGLSGCGEGNTKPTPSPTASVKELNASESPSETPTPEQKPTPPVDVDPPERPAAMDNANEAGAVAAAEYYLRLTVYAAATGDTSELETMSDEGCKFCDNYISSVNELHGDGGWAAVSVVETSDMQVWTLEDQANTYQVELWAERGPYDYFSGSGEVVLHDRESTGIAFVISTEDGWKLRAVETFKIDSEG